MSETRAKASARGHLAACEVITFRSIATEMGKLDELPAELDRDDLGIMRCAEGCPVIAEAVEYGKELAERFGW